MTEEDPDVARALLHALDPVAFAVERLRFQPDAWQSRVLRSSSKRIILNMTRQAGKTTVTAILALHTAIYDPGALVLLFSKGIRQSSELLAKIEQFISTMVDPPRTNKNAATEIELHNRSRMVSLPGDGDTIRGYSAPRLIVEDEAGFVLDSLYETFLPMLATSNGRLVLLSTPNGKRGHFHAVWSSGNPRWHRETITAHDVPRISAEYLDEALSELGPYRFQQEFMCKFVEEEGQYFSDEAIERAFSRSPKLLELEF